MSNYDRESEKLARLVQLLKDKINKSRKKLHGLGYSRHETEQHIERIAARAVKTDLSKHSLVKILKANRSQKVLTQLIQCFDCYSTSIDDCTDSELSPQSPLKLESLPSEVHSQEEVSRKSRHLRFKNDCTFREMRRDIECRRAHDRLLLKRREDHDILMLQMLQRSRRELRRQFI